MPKVSTSVAAKAVTNVRTEVKLTPSVRKALLKAGESWEVNNRLSSEAEKAKDKAKAEVDAVMSAAGEFKALEEGIEVGRYKMKYSSGDRTFYDDDKLRKYLTPAQMEACKTTVPTKGSVRISAGKE
jgi:hypothetical protein